MPRALHGEIPILEASANIRRHYRCRHRRQAYSTRRCELIVGVRRGRGETGGIPGKLGC
jgi:hypothetical protein